MSNRTHCVQKYEMTFILTPTKWNLDKHDISTFSASERPVGTAYETLKTHCSKANNAFTGFTKEVGALLAIVVRCEEDIWYQESRIQQEWAGLGRAFMSGEARHLAARRPWVVPVWANGWPFVSSSVGIGKGLSPRERRDVYSLEHTFAEQLITVLLYVLYYSFDVWLWKRLERAGKGETEILDWITTSNIIIIE